MSTPLSLSLLGYIGAKTTILSFFVMLLTVAVQVDCRKHTALAGYGAPTDMICFIAGTLGFVEPHCLA